MPRVEYREVIKEVPRIEYRERLIEIPQIVIEETTRVAEPLRTFTEKVVEKPVITTREEIEYYDEIITKEVPVDVFVEVPEIEYVYKDVVFEVRKK
jgi:hypothetical protein